MTKKDLMFNAGIPTAPDVKTLDDVYPDLPEGMIITWEDISTATGIERGSHRFKTVVGAWRNKLERQKNIILGAVPGVGLKVLNRVERCELGGAKLKHGLRSSKRGGSIVLKTDKTGLPPEVIRAADHVVKLSAMVTTLAATEAKRLRYPDPVLKLNK